MRQPVAAADRLRHRVTEAQPRKRERVPGDIGPRKQLRPRLPVLPQGSHARKRLVDRPGAFEGEHVRLGIPAFDVERLGAVCERVHGGAHRFLER